MGVVEFEVGGGGEVVDGVWGGGEDFVGGEGVLVGFEVVGGVGEVEGVVLD